MYEFRRTIKPMSDHRLPQPHRDVLDLATVLHALSDPVRLEIVRDLYGCEAERACGSFEAPVSKSTLTHHFRVLREAGLISQRQCGTSRLTSLRAEDLEARFPGLLAPVAAAARPATPVA
jgi:DNA-binding transcriptional ArsR family regulator